MFSSLISNLSTKMADTTAVLTTGAQVSTYKEVTTSSMILALVLGVVMGFLISALYIFTHKKSGYSQSYVVTLLILPSIISIVLVMINSMASALTLAGVFTLCRYRTVPGDPKDITYVFFAMAAGVICGICDVEHLWFVFLFYVIIAVVLALVETLRYGVSKTSSMTLKITIPENLNYIGLFDETLNKNTTKWRLKKVKTTNFGSLFELVYSIEMKNTADQKQFIDDIRKLNGNLTVILSLYRFEDAIYDK